MPVAKSTPRFTHTLPKSPIETPRPAAKVSRLPGWLRDVLGIAIFIIVVVVGATLINQFVFRSFNVVGPSMETTLDGGVGGDPSDRLIVNRMAVTWANMTGHDYSPPRGEIIVFRNPNFQTGMRDEYIVKRVIGLAGERVTVGDCTLKVHNAEHPDGFDPYPDFDNVGNPNTCVAGDGTDVTVPSGEIFVVGDHRDGDFSMDSRNGGGRPSLGLIPLNDIIGPVSLRIWPLNKLKTF
jgi:signal peptidase I